MTVTTDTTGTSKQKTNNAFIERILFFPMNSRVPSTVMYSCWLQDAESRWSATPHKTEKKKKKTSDLLRCRDCVGESGSLTANPSESHLCFSPPHLRPFSSSLVPRPPPVKELCRGSGEGGETEGTFSSGCFLWFRV